MRPDYSKSTSSKGVAAEESGRDDGAKVEENKKTRKENFEETSEEDS